MKRIFKYALPIDDVVKIEMPAFAKVLHIGEQGGELYLWASVNPLVPSLTYTFRVVVTGHPFDDDGWEYLGTAHCGPFVWHVFQLEAKREPHA